MQIYNRLQSRMATVLIPLGFFVPDEDDETMAVGETSGVDVGRHQQKHISYRTRATMASIHINIPAPLQRAIKILEIVYVPNSGDAYKRSQF